jgi:hypothetical protein
MFRAKQTPILAPVLTKDRLMVLARFIRNQIGLADRPPPSCIQLNNDEALLCAEALEAVADEPTARHPDSVNTIGIIAPPREPSVKQAVEIKIVADGGSQFTLDLTAEELNGVKKVAAACEEIREAKDDEYLPCVEINGQTEPPASPLEWRTL